MKPDNDLTYVTKILIGEIKHFEFLINKYKDKIFVLMLRFTKNREDAEELVQDTFIKAFKSLNTFKGEAKFSTWIYRIAYNTGVSHLRKKQNVLNLKDDTDVENTYFTEDFSLLNQLQKEEQKHFLSLTLDRLSESDSFILTLYYLNECTVDEIEKITGFGQSNIKVKLMRARRKLLVELQKELNSEVKSLL